MLLAAVMGAAGSSSLRAQSDPGTPLEIGRTYTIASSVLGETRVIDVTLPDGYEANPDRRYPVVVVLDGEFEHRIAAAVSSFYADMSQLPPMIVVGVRNTNRTRDMTPPPVGDFRVPPEVGMHGGAGRFLDFLERELLPHLDRTWRTAPMRVLVGHSLGGLLAMHALAQRPGLFTGYVVMEPATWWNRERDLSDATAVLRGAEARRARVMMVNTRALDVDTTAWGGTAPMVRHLETAGETHGSMALQGMMLGLRTMFADFKPSEWRPGTRPIAMLERYDSLAERIGYAVPIPGSAFSTVSRMSIDARHYEDAERVLARWERALGASPGLREMRAKLTRERASPPDGRFVQLEIPARRPTPAQARAFLGRWRLDGPDRDYEVEVRAAGDTITVFDRSRTGDREWWEGFRPVIQVTADGTLEWGLPVFRGLAALQVMQARVLPDGTLRLANEVRGWVPVGPGPDVARVDVLRRVDE